METLEIVWLILSGLTVVVAALLVVFAVIQAAVLIASGWAWSWAVTTEYVDKWVHTAKLLGLSIVLLGAAAFMDGIATDSVSERAGETIVSLVIGATIYTTVAEGVRVIRRHKEQKSRPNPEQR